MGASSLMGSCSSLAVRRSSGEAMGSSCTCGSCRPSERGDCLRGGNGWCVVRWNRGGKQRTTV